MDSKLFHESLREGEIAIVDYLVSGANIILPYGMEILSCLEGPILEGFSEMGYKEAGLPEVLPKDYVEHLRQEGLFRVDSDSGSFYMAASEEMPAAFLMGRVVKTYRDLPLRIYSKNRARRNEKRNALIKDIEYYSYEFNGFFETAEEARQEMDSANRTFCKAINELNIPYVIVSQPDKNGPVEIYSPFPHSEYVGCLFWSCIVGGKYVDRVSAGFQNRKNEKSLPIHLNMGFTSRILASYLSNHMDDYGFVLDPSIAPFQAMVPELDMPNRAKFVESALKDQGVTYSGFNIRNRKIAFKKFQSMGAPLLALPGRTETQLCLRKDMNSEWVSDEQLHGKISIMMQGLKPIRKEIEIKDVANLEDVPEDPSVILNVDAASVLDLESLGYKNIGLLDDGSIAFARFVY